MKDVEFKESLWSLSPEDLTSSEKCVQGRAKFRADHGVSIDIPLGKLLNIKPDSNDMVIHSAGRPPHADAIWGISQDGYFQTVIDLHEARSGFSAPGFEYQTLTGREIYSCKSEPVEANPLISRFTFKIRGLREWVGVSPFTEIFRLSENISHIEEYCLSFSHEDAPDVSLLSQDGVTIGLDHVWTSSGGSLPTHHFEFDCMSDYLIALSFDNQIELDRALEEWVFPTRQFLNFCMGFRSDMHNMRFTITSGAVVDYYAPISSGSEINDNDLASMPFTWKRSSDTIPSMLEAWLSFDDQSKVAARRAIALLNPKPIPSIDALFSATANAFEAITRIGVNPYSISPAEHRNRTESIVALIEDENTRRWLKQKLSFSNLKSAHELAGEQLDRLGPVADYLIPDKDRYLKEHRDTRNYYSHLDPRNKSHILKPGRELAVNAKATHLLLYFSICLLLGLHTEDILTAIKKSRFKEYSIYRIQKQYRYYG